MLKKLLRYPAKLVGGNDRPEIYRDYYYQDATLFPLGQAYNRGREIGQNVHELFKRGELVGRGANRAHDYGVLAQMVFNGGGADYLEIGTLFGASAIVAGLIKNEYGLGGRVFCVDPLDGYYDKQVDPVSRIAPTVKTLQKNLNRCGINNAVIVPDKSVPFPELLKEEEFGTVFIDGDHWNGVPLKDWENTKLRTNKYIMFDDYDRLHGDVVGAVKIAQNDPCWTAVLIHSVLALLEYTGNEK